VASTVVGSCSPGGPLIPMRRRRSTHSAEYRRHLASPEWAAIRKQALERAGDRCQMCNRPVAKGRPLHVHHRTYVNLGHELPEDLIVLCAGKGGCHHAADAQRRLATGTKPPAKKRKRSRRRRRGGPLREMRRIFVVLGSAYGGLWLASIVLPHVS
jgi:5-methylcytosine-specific restriction endonuclease McrA